MYPTFIKLSKFRFGLLYVSLIPIFAILYYLLPQGFIDYGSLGKSVISCIYYSTVTITTLGYGDIVPLNGIAAGLVSAESILGIITIGLFLNSISQRQYEISSKDKKESTKRRRYLRELDKMVQYCKIIDIEMSLILEEIEESHRHAPPHLRRLLTSIKELIMEINMRSFPSFERLCIDFIAANLKAETQSAQLQLVNSNIKFIEDFRKEISSFQRELDRYSHEDYWA